MNHIRRSVFKFSSKFCFRTCFCNSIFIFAHHSNCRRSLALALSVPLYRSLLYFWCIVWCDVVWCGVARFLCQSVSQSVSRKTGSNSMAVYRDMTRASRTTTIRCNDELTSLRASMHARTHDSMMILYRMFGSLLCSITTSFDESIFNRCARHIPVRLVNLVKISRYESVVFFIFIFHSDDNFKHDPNIDRVGVQTSYKFFGMFLAWGALSSSACEYNRSNITID